MHGLVASAADFIKRDRGRAAFVVAVGGFPRPHMSGKAEQASQKIGV
jgi:hypothetical protein